MTGAADPTWAVASGGNPATRVLVRGSMWDTIVSGLQGVIFALGHLTGSLGTGVFVTALLLRAAFLPVGIHLARRAREQQQRFAGLRPELELLQTTHAHDPVRLQRETFALFRRHGYRPLDPPTLAGGLLQLPPLSAMYAALRSGFGNGVSFAWIATLARPDAGLVIIVAALSATAALFGTPPGATRGTLFTTVLLAGGLTAFFLAATSSAMALSVAASSLVSGLQGWYLQREQRRAA